MWVLGQTGTWGWAEQNQATAFSGSGVLAVGTHTQHSGSSPSSSALLPFPLPLPVWSECSYDGVFCPELNPALTLCCVITVAARVSRPAVSAYHSGPSGHVWPGHVQWVLCCCHSMHVLVCRNPTTQDYFCFEQPALF